MLTRQATVKASCNEEVDVMPAGWPGCDEDEVRRLMPEAFQQGFDHFKMKVRVKVKSDLHRGRVMTQRSARWLGYEDDKMRRLTLEALQLGFNHLKMKVGFNVEADLRRGETIRVDLTNISK